MTRYSQQLVLADAHRVVDTNLGTGYLWSGKNMLGKWSVYCTAIWQRLLASCQSMQEFQARVWVVSIHNNDSDHDALFNDTFVVNEDSFSTPMSWMHKRGYTQLMLTRIDNMQRSQVVTVFLENESHSLIRVK